ncbi:hypothetical protein [Micromonospora sp. NBC_01796]|uniref:hypothetical protein n=1 Tax=Micromonospora sp. NBC_01796 TaxID=2975987 RepID=UPI002DD80635|nr:hypothetical protein [Micromonospora sp. NBC_01796]WSA82691.1 hypothetical protein OIE47_19725 [Micromonospora sp. NBC_01796]
MTTPESPDTLAGTAIERLTPYLPAIGTTGAVEPGGDTAARSLHDLLAARLRAMGEAEALAEFVRQPRNNSLVRRLLTTAVHDDPAYAAELAGAVAALPPDGPETTPAATRNDSPDRPAPVGGRRLSRRTLLVALAVLTVAVVVVCLVARNILGDLDDSGGLTTQSSCADFRQAPREDRSRALRAIALARGLPELDTPLALTAVTQACAAEPDSRLGDVVARLGN